MHINIVDTPGHADFGGEVERVLSMVDGVLLLVDAVEGPMPQTRFVTRKALAQGLKPIVVVNKVDRDGARVRLGRGPDLRPDGQAGRHRGPARFPGDLRLGPERLGLDRRSGEVGTDMRPLFDAVLKHVPEPKGDPEGPLQLQIAAVDYSSFLGRIAIGRIRRGTIKKPAGSRDQSRRQAHPQGQDRRDPHVPGPRQGRDLESPPPARSCRSPASRTSSSAPRSPIPSTPEGLPMVGVDEPTLTMNFQVNTSPLRRPGRQVRHQPPDPRAPRPRAARQRGAARRGDRRQRRVPRLGPRRIAPHDPHREHAPRRLRARGGQAARGRQGGRRRAPASRGRTSRSTSRPTTRARSWKSSAAAAASCRTWCRTARGACASTTASRRAASSASTWNS